MESFSVYAEKFSVYTEGFSIYTENLSMKFVPHPQHLSIGVKESLLTNAYNFQKHPKNLYEKGKIPIFATKSVKTTKVMPMKH